MSETCRGHLWDKIIVKLFASSWYILLTYCCKILNKQSSGVQERINPFYINSYGENSFGLRTFRFTNELQERIKFVNRGLYYDSIIAYGSRKRRGVSTSDAFECVPVWTSNAENLAVRRNDSLRAGRRQHAIQQLCHSAGDRSHPSNPSAATPNEDLTQIRQYKEYPPDGPWSCWLAANCRIAAKAVRLRRRHYARLGAQLSLTLCDAFRAFMVVI